MKTLYYLMGILPIFIECAKVFDPKKIVKEIEGVKAEKDIEKMIKNGGCFWIAVQLYYMIWSIAGLVTAQWPVFLLLIVLSFIPKKNIAVFWLNALFSLLALIFILINEFHLHIDLQGMIL